MSSGVTGREHPRISGAVLHLQLEKPGRRIAGTVEEVIHLSGQIDESEVARKTSLSSTPDSLVVHEKTCVALLTITRLCDDRGLPFRKKTLECGVWILNLHGVVYMSEAPVVML